MITTTESMRKQQWLCVLCFAFHAGLATGTCPENEYAAQAQKYKIEFQNDATWKYSDFAAYTQAPMLDRASSMLTKEELFDFLDNSGQTTFPVVGADEWTTVIDYENGDAPSYVRWYQVGTAGGSGYKSMSSWKTYSQGGGTGITALETNYDWLGYNFRWQATTCDGGGVSCHSKVVTECKTLPLWVDVSCRLDLIRRMYVKQTPTQKPCSAPSPTHFYSTPTRGRTRGPRRRHLPRHKAGACRHWTSSGRTKPTPGISRQGTSTNGFL